MVNRVALAVAALSVSFLILSKVFLYSDCYSFDSHDDSNHAFPSLHVARAAMAAGELPTINYFNNFGAPLLGDGLAYPLAVQALTYAFFENHWAMTINRFLIAILTVLSAYLLFRLHLERVPSTICAVLIYFNPIAFWCPVHQYQAAAPFFFLGLWLIERYARSPNLKWVFSLFIFSVLCILSVSINLVGMMLPFFFFWLLCARRWSQPKLLLPPIAAFVGAMIFTFPQTLDFILYFRQGVRGGEGVYQSVLTNFRELALGLLVPPSEWLAYNFGAPLQVSTYISAPVIMMIVFGMFLAFRRSSSYFLKLFLCGIVPTILAIVLYYCQTLRFALPVVRAVDITRVLWFSLPVCYFFVGEALSRFQVDKSIRKAATASLCIGLLALAATNLLAEAQFISPLHSISILLCLGFFGIVIFANAKLSLASWILAICSLVLVPIPVVVRVMDLNAKRCHGSQYSDTLEAANFQPLSFIGKMERQSRIATEIHTHRGQDLRAASWEILGSDARAISIDKFFGKYLESKNLVTVDQVPYGYYFSRPWQPDELTKLGIRYLVVAQPLEENLVQDGWNQLAKDEGLYLYENPKRPSPIYLISKDGAVENLRNYDFSGNHIRIELPNLNDTASLVISILNRPGFKAQIDGNQVQVGQLENSFISLEVSPGQSLVEVVHKPYSASQILCGAFSGVLLCASLGFFCLRRTRDDEKSRT